MADDFDVEALLEGALKNKGKLPEEPKETKDDKASSEKDKERDKDKDHDSRKRSRDRDKDRDERRHRSRRTRSRSPRDRHRRRSRSREDRSGGGGGKYSDQRERERDKVRERRRREDERKYQRERESLMTPGEREAAETERDGRTVFAFNLPLKADEDDIAAFFTKAGKVRDIRLITDRNSRKHKGFAYIEFFDRDSVPPALHFAGTQMMGHTIQVQQSQAEKNRVAQAAAAAKSPPAPTRVYIGSLHVNTNEDTLRRVFSRYGEIESLSIHYDPETQRSKGFGFVQYRRPEDSKRALQQANGMEIDGTNIKVNFVNEGKNTNMPALRGGDLDDDDMGGMQLNAQSRMILMEKLQRSELQTRANEAAKAQEHQASLNAIPTAPPSATILLTNMFDPAEETEPNWEREIEEETKEECSKFGAVVHIFADKHSKGYLYMKFGSIPGAQNAINALNMRWFAGRMITAEFYPEARYYAKFPDARAK